MEDGVSIQTSLATVVAVSELGVSAAAGKRGSVTQGRRTQSVRKGSSLRTSWKLKYQDFLPANKEEFGGKSEHFQKLLDKANAWLRKNPDVGVKTCETVTWMSPNFKRLGDSEEMVLSKQLREGTTNYYARGLRLWLVHQCTRRSQTLAYEDFVPEETDNIQDLVDKANRKVETKHLNADRVLTVETVGCPVLGDRICHRVTRWREGVDNDAPYVFVLRVFYTKTNRKTEQSKTKTLIGLKDMVPLATDDSCYEGFEVLTEKVNIWLKEDPDVVTITNLQSVMVQQNEDPHNSLGSSCRYSMPGINNPEPMEFFRILRVAYLRLDSSDPSESPRLNPDLMHPVVYETFTPELVREKEGGIGGGIGGVGGGGGSGGTGLVERLERMKETFAKVIAFLRNSGAEVICAETVMNPMQLYCAPDEAGNQTNGCYDDEMKFLFTIRLFLVGPLHGAQLTNGMSTRLIKRGSSSASLNEDQSAKYRSSPLFLGSVVTRQFRYRWLVLGISAVTSMAIIVIVSVVYSNRP